MNARNITIDTCVLTQCHLACTVASVESHAPEQNPTQQKDRFKGESHNVANYFMLIGDNFTDYAFPLHLAAVMTGALRVCATGIFTRIPTAATPTARRGLVIFP